MEYKNLFPEILFVLLRKIYYKLSVTCPRGEYIQEKCKSKEDTGFAGVVVDHSPGELLDVN